MSTKVHVIFFVDAARVPARVAQHLADGAVLPLGGCDNAGDCLVGSIGWQEKPNFHGYAAICRLCPSSKRVISNESAYEHAEAKVIRHLRQEHVVFTALWMYDEDLRVHPIS